MRKDHVKIKRNNTLFIIMYSLWRMGICRISKPTKDSNREYKLLNGETITRPHTDIVFDELDITDVDLKVIFATKEKLKKGTVVECLHPVENEVLFCGTLAEDMTQEQIRKNIIRVHRGNNITAKIRFMQFKVKEQSEKNVEHDD